MASPLPFAVRRLLYWGALSGAPVLLFQGRRVRRIAPSLPEHADQRSGVVPGGPLTTKLALLGDSTASGVGTHRSEQALAGQVARHLGSLTGHTVHWSAVGRTGETIGSMLARLRSKDAVDLHRLVSESHVILVSLGVNDATSLVPVRRWRSGVMLLRDELRRLSKAPVVFSAVPPIQHFPALPEPLASFLGLRASILDHVLASTIEQIEDLHYFVPDFSFEKRYIAADGYHPSAAGYAYWGRLAAEFILRRELAATLHDAVDLGGKLAQRTGT